MGRTRIRGPICHRHRVLSHSHYLRLPTDQHDYDEQLPGDDQDHASCDDDDDDLDNLGSGGKVHPKVLQERLGHTWTSTVTPCRGCTPEVSRGVR